MHHILLCVAALGFSALLLHLAPRCEAGSPSTVIGSKLLVAGCPLTTTKKD